MSQDYRLLVLDLDGTLTNSKKEISPRNLRTLLRLQQSGIRLVLASGRPTYGIAPLAEQLQMKEHNGYILSYNGGEIIDWSTGELLYKNLLPDDVLPVLYQAAADHKQAILTYDNEFILTEHPDDPYVVKEAFLNKMQIRRTDNFLQDAPLPLPKCLIVGEPEQLVQTEAELSLRLQNRISVYRSEPYFLELVPLGIDKARSLAVLLEKSGIAREEMVAMGDGYNDLSMIEYAGLGIAMGNAQVTVKAAADYIAPTNDEDGVAVAVEHYFPHAF
ncbi:Cof-type HAD-IIB family hydrolase [uncultured Bacteroides sp.]|uniref:Cof-type HAD-IIB family hydrolase n=1 Tax=uncultured Bacteroides sp. TaxID=162156 RepID=UPI0025CF5787|nr:Cof-type HAD-IIB family hydrolase [uncultured Bacteroides sp.]